MVQGVFRTLSPMNVFLWASRDMSDLPQSKTPRDMRMSLIIISGAIDSAVALPHHFIGMVPHFTLLRPGSFWLIRRRRAETSPTPRCTEGIAQAQGLVRLEQLLESPGRGARWT